MSNVIVALKLDRFMPRQLFEPFCRSLMRIDVSVRVTLAKKKMPIEQVVRLVPGVMIQFNKPCESPMTIEVGDREIGLGEVVKIGDKFGVRISEITKPGEQFIKLYTGSAIPNAN